MNDCLTCGKKTNNAKFCSRSCAASFNNKGVRRHGKSNKKACLNCGTLTDNLKYCSQKCQHEDAHKEIIKEWKNGGFIGHKPLKKYLREKKNACWECGITEWNGKKIVFELEHIDGNSENNSEDNVSLLCPNCHSQTDTYKGKNKGKGRHYRRVRYAEGKSY